MAEQWYSDMALDKQRTIRELLSRGETVPLSVLDGALEPRVRPTDAELCDCCGGDARPEVGGLAGSNGKMFCFICVGRGHYEDGGAS